jgi:hypothetical protein
MSKPYRAVFISISLREPLWNDPSLSQISRLLKGRQSLTARLFAKAGHGAICEIISPDRMAEINQAYCGKSVSWCAICFSTAARVNTQGLYFAMLAAATIAALTASRGPITEPACKTAITRRSPSGKPYDQA